MEFGVPVFGATTHAAHKQRMPRMLRTESEVGCRGAMDLGALYNPITHQSYAGTGIFHDIYPAGTWGPARALAYNYSTVILCSGVQGIPRWIAEVQWISANYISGMSRADFDFRPMAMAWGA